MSKTIASLNDKVKKNEFKNNSKTHKEIYITKPQKHTEMERNICACA